MWDTIRAGFHYRSETFKRTKPSPKQRIDWLQWRVHLFRPFKSAGCSGSPLQCQMLKMMIIHSTKQYSTVGSSSLCGWSYSSHIYFVVGILCIMRWSPAFYGFSLVPLFIFWQNTHQRACISMRSSQSRTCNAWTVRLALSIHNSIFGNTLLSKTCLSVILMDKKSFVTRADLTIPASSFRQ